MAGLEFKFDSKEFGIFDDIRKRFPDFRRQAMGYVGARGKEILFEKFLRGQDLTYKGPNDVWKQKSKLGQRKVTYNILRYGQAVRIYSFPLNLFEKATYGGGRKIGGGKRILTQKFKSVMESSLQKILNDFDNQVLQGLIDEDSFQSRKG